MVRVLIQRKRTVKHENRKKFQSSSPWEAEPIMILGCVICVLVGLYVGIIIGKT